MKTMNKSTTLGVFQVLAIQRPLNLAYMSNPASSDASSLKHDVREVHHARAVRDTEPDGDGAQFAVALG